jgi:hypothetical protein
MCGVGCVCVYLVQPEVFNFLTNSDMELISTSSTSLFPILALDGFSKIMMKQLYSLTCHLARLESM